MEATGVLVPAACAGGVAIAATVAIERFGGRLGGLLATLPTTIVPAAVGMFLGSADLADYRAGLFIMPAGMLVNAFFLWVWRVLPARLVWRRLGARLAAITLVSLLAWAVAAALCVVAVGLLAHTGVPGAAIALVLTLVLAASGALACARGVPAPRGHRRVRLGALLLRGLMAAVAIGGAVMLQQLGNPLLAGMAAVFPAIFLTTMVSLWLAQGEAVPAGAVGPMMLGSTSVCAYALVAAFSLPALGAWMGSFVAWWGAVLVATLPAWLWLRSRQPLQSGE